MPNNPILIYGGSFDPPHDEHIRLLQTAIHFIEPSKIYVFPSFNTPLKTKSVASLGNRFTMAKLAFKDIAGKICVSPLELKKNRRTYTYQVVSYVKKRHPNAKLYFLAGSDCLNFFTKWKKYDYVLKNACLLIAKRKNYPVPDKLNFKYTCLPNTFKETSSGRIRRNIYLNGKIPAQVPERVAKFIIKNKLYGLDIHHWLKKNVPIRRYVHTINSAQLALELAEKHNLDGLKTLQAALLHDCAKGLSVKELIDYAIKHNLKPVNKKLIIANQPSLLHSYVSADIARKELSIKDKEILNAIAFHTLGDSSMNKLAKVIFVADISSIDRKFKEAEHIRKLALSDLHDAFMLSLETKLFYVIERNKWLCPHSVHLWNKMIEKKP